MKFRVHVFREYRETYEVEADNHDDARNKVDEPINDIAPVQTEMQGYLPHSLVDPLLAGGVVDYENSRWLNKGNQMQKLTKEQAVIISGYTGVLICQFSDLHFDVEQRLGHPVWTHQFGDKEFSESVAELYKDDFIDMAPEG